MATWDDLSRDAMLAATDLLRNDHVRSSMSRAYYAAYSAVAARMAKEAATFPHGWNNPSHDQIVRWLTFARQRLPRQAVTAVRRLRFGRETADYRPRATLTRADAVRSIRDADLVLRAMGVPDEDSN